MGGKDGDCSQEDGGDADAELPSMDDAEMSNSVSICSISDLALVVRKQPL